MLRPCANAGVLRWGSALRFCAEEKGGVRIDGLIWMDWRGVNVLGGEQGLLNP